MQRNQIEEFYRELDATQEAYIRKKYREGGYAGWKSKHAKTWLDEREAAKSEEHTTRIARWTMFGSAATVLLAIITAIGLFHHTP
jgi:hypothetical protein